MRVLRIVSFWRPLPAGIGEAQRPVIARCSAMQRLENTPKSSAPLADDASAPAREFHQSPPSPGLRPSGLSLVARDRRRLATSRAAWSAALNWFAVRASTWPRPTRRSTASDACVCISRARTAQSFSSARRFWLRARPRRGGEATIERLSLAQTPLPADLAYSSRSMSLACLAAGIYADVGTHDRAGAGRVNYGGQAMRMILAAAVLAALALPASARTTLTARNGISWTIALTCACLSAPGACRTPHNGRRAHTMAMPGRGGGLSSDGRSRCVADGLLPGLPCLAGQVNQFLVSCK